MSKESQVHYCAASFEYFIIEHGRGFVKSQDLVLINPILDYEIKSERGNEQGQRAAIEEREAHKGQ